MGAKPIALGAAIAALGAWQCRAAAGAIRRGAPEGRGERS